MNRVLLETRIKDKTVSIVHGDITLEDVDAIVNPANKHLRHGGGVAGAIVRRGGSIIQEESNKLAPVEVGNAVITTGGNLQARYVIHAVGPIWGEGEEEKKLRSAVRSAINLGDSKGLKSISIPAISTGIFGYPKRDGTRVILDQVIKTLPLCKNIEEVRLCNIDKYTCELFLEHMKSSKWSSS